MSSRAVAIGGITYLRSRDAGRVVSLAPDYISRLARFGFVAGQRVDGLWFVNLSSLKQFIAEQERQKEAWRARMPRLRREEQRLAGHPAAFA